MPYISTDKYNIYYEERNPSSPKVLLFLHGIPVDCTLWKGVMDHIAGGARMIAPDLIGFGKSSKPLSIEYDIHAYTDCLEHFVTQMGLRNIILVAMDLGLMVGLHYYSQHPDDIAGIVMFEGMMTDLDVVIGSQSPFSRSLMKLLKNDSLARKMFVQNGLSSIRNMISQGSYSKEINLEHYVENFKDIQVREKVLFEGLASNKIAKGLTGEGVGEAVKQYARALERSSVPKLLLHAKPGAAVSQKLVIRLEKKIRNLKAEYIGKGKHYLPFDLPEKISDAILRFLDELNTAGGDEAASGG